MLGWLPRQILPWFLPAPKRISGNSEFHSHLAWLLNRRVDVRSSMLSLCPLLPFIRQVRLKLRLLSTALVRLE